MLKTLKRWAENIEWLFNHPAKITEAKFDCKYCGETGILNLAGTRFCRYCLDKVITKVLADIKKESEISGN